MDRVIRAWCWHRFPKWTDVGSGTLTERNVKDPKQETRIIGFFTQQERRCEKCGLLHMRRERTVL